MTKLSHPCRCGVLHEQRTSALERAANEVNHWGAGTVLSPNMNDSDDESSRGDFDFQNRTKSWFWAFVGPASMFILLTTILDWHDTSKALRFSQEQWQSIMNSSFYYADPDDATREEHCRNYIWHFLNGTTDSHDECEGFYNAFDAANCKEQQVLLGEDDNSTIISNDDFNNMLCCENIEDYYKKNCESESGLDAGRLLGIASVLVVCGFMRTIIRTVGIMKWVPNAGVCVLVGAVSGGIVRLVSATVVKDKFAFDNDLFLQIMLPPIIFQAAICIDKRAFRRDLWAILTFAILGTGVSAVAIGLITFHMSGSLSGVSLPLLDCMLFGALMSSIDPVATLGILTSVGVSQSDTLYTLIFGESLLNDGVSIVLFDSLVKHMGKADIVGAATIKATLGDFFWVTTGSVFIGSVCGAFCALYFWLLQGKQTAVAEVGLFFAWAFIPYYIADGVGLSGIIAILVMGLTMDYYVIGGQEDEDQEWLDYVALRHHSDQVLPEETTYTRIMAAFSKTFSGRGHITDESREHVGFVAEVIASLMETAIFAYLGLFLFNEQDWKFMLMASGIVACVASRAGMVVSLSMLVNFCIWIDLEGFLGRQLQDIRPPPRHQIRLDRDDSQYSTKSYISRRMQIILFSAGVRGAVSYALVQNIPVYNYVTNKGSQYKGELKAMTSATIVLLLFVFGAVTFYAVQGPTEDNADREADRRRFERSLLSSSIGADEGLSDSPQHQLHQPQQHFAGNGGQHVDGGSVQYAPAQMIS